METLGSCARSERKGAGISHKGRREAAEQVLEAALAADPGHERLTRALSDVRLALETKRRNEAVEELCRKAEARSAALDFESALAAIDQGRELYGDDSRLTGAREEIVRAQTHWQREETVRAAIVESDRHLSANEPEQAIERIEAALGRYPGEVGSPPGWLKPGRRLRQNSARTPSPASSGTPAGNWKTATSMARSLRSIAVSPPWGKMAGLTSLRESVIKARADWERNRAIGAAFEQSRQLSEKDQFDVAVEVLEEALRLYPDADGLSAALTRAREQLAAKIREASVEKLLREVRVRLDQQHFEQALEELDSGLHALGPDDRLARLREEVLTARTDWERAQAVQQALEDANRQLAANKPDAALEILQAASRQFPQESVLTGAVDGARQALQAKRREEAILSALEHAEGHLDGREFDRALAIIDDAAAHHGPDIRLSRSQNEIASAKEAWERSEFIRHALRASEEQVADGEPERACLQLEAALNRYPDEEVLRAAAAEARGAWDAQRREGAIQALCADVLPASSGSSSTVRSIVLARD